MSEHQIKKLIYRSNYRGCKESDILFSNFAEKYIRAMNVSELALYSDLLDEYDGDILNWVMGKKPTPEIYQEIIDKLRKL